MTAVEIFRILSIVGNEGIRFKREHDAHWWVYVSDDIWEFSVEDLIADDWHFDKTQRASEGKRK